MAGREEPVLAATVLEPIYEGAGEWDRVIAVQEVMQANTEDAVRKVELLCRIAELEERRLSHQNAAFDAYGRALRVDPNNQDVLAHLGRLAADSIFFRDFPMLQGVVLILALAVLLANLVTDFLYALLDPRIRYR